jgi:hypothetical protein
VGAVVIWEEEGEQEAEGEKGEEEEGEEADGEEGKGEWEKATGDEVASWRGSTGERESEGEGEVLTHATFSGITEDKLLEVHLPCIFV